MNNQRINRLTATGQALTYQYVFPYGPAESMRIGFSIAVITTVCYRSGRPSGVWACPTALIPGTALEKSGWPPIGSSVGINY